MQFVKEVIPLELGQLPKFWSKGSLSRAKRGTIREGGHTVGAGAVTEILE